MTKEEKCQQLHFLYAHLNPQFRFDVLMTHNERQIDTLFTACQDENGEFTSYQKNKGI